MGTEVRIQLDATLNDDDMESVNEAIAEAFENIGINPEELALISFRQEDDFIDRHTNKDWRTGL